MISKRCEDTVIIPIKLECDPLTKNDSITVFEQFLPWLSTSVPLTVLLLFPNWPILLAGENGDCPAISVPQNGSVSQEAPNLLNQAEVCHFQPTEKLACGITVRGYNRGRMLITEFCTA